jgi:hypothetical protein
MRRCLVLVVWYKERGRNRKGKEGDILEDYDSVDRKRGRETVGYAHVGEVVPGCKETQSRS